MEMRLLFIRIIGLIVIFATLAGCTNSPGDIGTSVWIDVPVNGKNYAEIQPIQIEGHAASKNGIAKVEIHINGELSTSLEGLSKEGDLYRYSHTFSPPGSGTYVIQAVAFDGAGNASTADSTKVTIGVEQATSTASPTPTLDEEITATPTITPTDMVTLTPTIPGPLVEFIADPAAIQAGECTTLKWHAENVSRIIFGGVDQPFDGSYQDCLCKNERYSLTIIHQDGREEKKQVDIAVEGECVTPTPPGDTTPPLAPAPAVPADGLSIGCKASQSLTWLPVSDPSGISRYEVKVQRNGGDNNWKAVSGSVFTITSGKTMSLPVECGFYYRWQVRAVDGNGNTGAWSAWSRFSVTIS